MSDLRAYAQGTVLHALMLELPGADHFELEWRAEAFIAISEAHRVPIDELLTWIHTVVPEKQWSLSEYRAWCAKYVELRDRLAGKRSLFGDEPDRSDVSAFEPRR